MNSLKRNLQRDLSRASILYFSGAFILTLIPQLILFLPIWVAILFVICFVWRIQIYKMRMNYPSGILKFVMIAAIIGILYLTKGNFLNTEGCTILFMSIYALKFIESRTVRDGYILCCIGFIALAAIYLFDSSIYIFLFSILIFITQLTALLGLQQAGYGFYSNKELLLNALKIMGISLPLMVILFVIFPRFPSMLPSIPKGTEQQAQTGVSNHMEPGSIAELAKSEKHIFWAEFNDYVPASKQLYWRSLTLNHFNGRTWSQMGENLRITESDYMINNRVGQEKYSVVFDPSYQRYLATLDISVMDRNRESRFNNIVGYSDFRFEYRHPIDTKIQYSATYIPNVTLLNPKNNKQGAADLKQYLQLSNNNPQTSEFVKKLMVNKPSAEQFVAELLKHFHEDGFRYTLEPGLLQSDNSIDEFMFEQKVGFCEHYASAMAFMLRKAGIPSRIVVGYLGGQVDSARKLVEVRGKDAHAWVEYWDDAKGWVRVDPTSAVAPDRIDLGIDDLLSSLLGIETPQLSAWDRFKNEIVQLQDLIDYRWTKMVLGYQSSLQQSMLKELFKLDVINVFTLVKISVSLLFAFVFVQIVIFLKPWQRLYFNLWREYQVIIGLINRSFRLELSVNIAPNELYDAVSSYLSPQQKVAIRAMIDALVAELYQPSPAQQTMGQVKQTMFAVQRLLKEKNVRQGNDTH